MSILSLLLLSNSLRVSAVYGWYTLDIESFVAQLCENTDKPELKCDGKCFLTKVAANTSSQDEQKTPILEWDQLVFCQLEVSFQEVALVPATRGNNHHYTALYSDMFSYAIFHPPKVYPFFI